MERRTASGWVVRKVEAACSDQKKRERSQKLARTQSRRSAGMISDITPEAWVRSLTIPSGVATNAIGRPVTGQLDWTCASAPSHGGNNTVSKAHHVKRSCPCI